MLVNYYISIICTQQTIKMNYSAIFTAIALMSTFTLTNSLSSPDIGSVTLKFFDVNQHHRRRTEFRLPETHR